MTTHEVEFLEVKRIVMVAGKVLAEFRPRLVKMDAECENLGGKRLD